VRSYPILIHIMARLKPQGTTPSTNSLNLLLYAVDERRIQIAIRTAQRNNESGDEVRICPSTLQMIPTLGKRDISHQLHYHYCDRDKGQEDPMFDRTSIHYFVILSFRRPVEPSIEPGASPSPTSPCSTGLSSTSITIQAPPGGRCTMHALWKSVDDPEGTGLGMTGTGNRR
jgi:hypothetical protein